MFNVRFMDDDAVKGRNKPVCASLAFPPSTLLEKILLRISRPVCVEADIARQFTELVTIAALVP